MYRQKKDEDIFDLIRAFIVGFLVVFGLGKLNKAITKYDTETRMAFIFKLVIGLAVIGYIAYLLFGDALRDPAFDPRNFNPIP